MPIYQRGKNKMWWIDFTAPNGDRIRQSSGTQNKQEAQELHDRLKSETWRVKNLGVKPRHTWKEAVVRWLTEQSHKKSIADDKKHLRWLNQHLDQISRVMIDQIKAKKQQTGVTNSSVNRLLAVIRAILNRAKNDWEWIDTVPSIRLLPEPPTRIRWLTHEEATRLIRELPPHLNAMVRFTLATGLRESNVTGLQWEQIDMTRCCAWIHADESKSGKAIALPLNTDAMAILRECEKMRSIVGIHIKNVFTYEGKPVTRANNHAWRKALKRANIENFRWHDLRHTWASWHIQNGTPLAELKDLGGWANLTMVLRYAHLSGDRLAHYAENVSGTNLSQAIKKP
jgi:integrase